VLEERGLQKKRGLIKGICQRTSMERHQISVLLENRAKYLSLETLANLCAYLVDHCHVPPPAAGDSLSSQPGGFWSLLAERAHLELSVGIRRDDELAERAW